MQLVDMCSANLAQFLVRAQDAHDIVDDSSGIGTQLLAQQLSGLDQLRAGWSRNGIWQATHAKSDITAVL